MGHTGGQSNEWEAFVRLLSSDRAILDVLLRGARRRYKAELSLLDPTPAARAEAWREAVREVQQNIAHAPWAPAALEFVGKSGSTEDFCRLNGHKSEESTFEITHHLASHLNIMSLGSTRSSPSLTLTTDRMHTPPPCDRV